jgi:hypothetical protein
MLIFIFHTQLLPLFFLSLLYTFYPLKFNFPVVTPPFSFPFTVCSLFDSSEIYILSVCSDCEGGVYFPSSGLLRNCLLISWQIVSRDIPVYCTIFYRYCCLRGWYPYIHTLCLQHPSSMSYKLYLFVWRIRPKPVLCSSNHHSGLLLRPETELRHRRLCLRIRCRWAYKKP